MPKKSPYFIDNFLGMEYYISSTEGIKGRLREKIEDFFVEEVVGSNLDNLDIEGDFIIALIEKYNIDTIEAVRRIAKFLNISQKRISFSGNKDKRAVARQYISIFGNKDVENKLRNIEKIGNIKIIKIFRSSFGINLGSAIGNKFKIIVRHAKNLENIEKILEELKNKGIPNYFGYQRFGTIRPNTHLVGREIVKGNFKRAVMIYLAEPFEKEKEDAKIARKFLQETMNYKKALKIFPKRLKYEIIMLEHLSKYPRDYIGAFRRLPKTLMKLFVHAYQSYLFNRVLSRIIKKEGYVYGKFVNIFGYETKKEELNDYEKEILEEEGIDLNSFKIKSFPEVSSRGLKREAFIETDIKYEIIDNNTVKFEFFLKKGCYATTVLREFMKTDPLNY